MLLGLARNRRCDSCLAQPPSQTRTSSRFQSNSARSAVGSLHILSLQLNLLPSHHGTATLHTSSLQRHRPTRNDNVSTHPQRRAAVLWLWNTYTWVCCVGPMRACVCQCASFAAFIIHVGGGSVCTVVCSPMCYVVLCVSCPGTRGGGGTTARVCGWCVDCAVRWCTDYSCTARL